MEEQVIKSRTRKLTARGLATRKLILSTTVELIAKQGYHASNIQLISEACGIPRGSILHQFPTRLDLMASVIEFITSEMTLNTQQLLAAEPDPKVRLLSFFDVVWGVARSDLSVANAEIQDASHWDADLADKVGRMTDVLEGGFIREFLSIAEAAGIAHPRALLPLLTMTLVSMRGFLVSFRLLEKETFLRPGHDYLRAHFNAALQQSLG